jgi:hypothetical protein
MTMTVIQTEKAEVVKYLVQAIRYYKDKKVMLIIPYNTGSHWVLLTISMRHNQVWYYDSNRPTDSATSKRGTHDYSEVMVLHFSFFIVSSLHDNFALTYEYNVSV